MEKVIELVRVDFSDLFGVGDIYLKLIEETLSVSIFSRGNLIKIKGRKKQISQAKEALSEMVNSIEGRGNLTTNDVEKILALISIEDPKKTWQNYRKSHHPFPSWPGYLCLDAMLVTH